MLGLVASAQVELGCAGQNVEGAWRGGLPLDGAESCLIRLGADGTFDASCPKGGILMEGGYRVSGDTFTLESKSYTFQNRAAVSRPVFEFRLEGRGNRMTLVKDRKSWEWERVFR